MKFTSLAPLHRAAVSVLSPYAAAAFLLWLFA
jgi:hypothetical protein